MLHFTPSLLKHLDAGTATLSAGPGSSRQLRRGRDWRVQPSGDPGSVQTPGTGWCKQREVSRLETGDTGPAHTVTRTLALRAGR